MYVRADACKARAVRIVAGAIVSNADDYPNDEFPHDASHALDGRIDVRDVRMNDELLGRELIPELCQKEGPGAIERAVAIVSVRAL